MLHIAPIILSIFGAVCGGQVYIAPDVKPIEAAVRVKYQNLTQNHEHYGSGTVLESSPERTLVSTCFHFESAKLPSDDTRYTIQWGKDFANQAQMSVIGQSSQYDTQLLTGPGNLGLKAVDHVDDREWVPRVGDVVHAVGSPLGVQPKEWLARKALWLDNEGKIVTDDTAIIVDHIPTSGESGGGLFSPTGTLIGICIGREPPANPKYGMYSRVTKLNEFLAMAKYKSHRTRQAERAVADVIIRDGQTAPAQVEKAPMPAPRPVEQTQFVLPPQAPQLQAAPRYSPPPTYQRSRKGRFHVR
jgi:hypothetical protein